MDSSVKSENVQIVYVDDVGYDPAKIPPGVVPFAVPYPKGKPPEPKRIKQLYKAMIDKKYTLVRNLIKKLTKSDHNYIQNLPLWYIALFNRIGIDLEMFKVLSLGCDFADKISTDQVKPNDTTAPPHYDIFHMIVIDCDNPNCEKITKYVFESIGEEKTRIMLGQLFNGITPLTSSTIYANVGLFKLFYSMTPEISINNNMLLRHALSANNNPISDYILKTYPDSIEGLIDSASTVFIDALTMPKSKYLRHCDCVDENNFNYNNATMMMKHHGEKLLCMCDRDGRSGIEYAVEFTSIGPSADKYLFEAMELFIQTFTIICYSGAVPQDFILRAYTRIIDISNTFMANILLGCLTRDSVMVAREYTKIKLNTVKNSDPKLADEIADVGKLLNRCDNCKIPPIGTKIKYCLCGCACYCNDECAIADWVNHRGDCTYGLRCGHCDSSKKTYKCLCGCARYCNDECAIADWVNHRDTCTHARM